MSTSEIIEGLKKYKVVPRLEGDQLKLFGETENLPGEFIEEIKAGKQELIDLLRKSDNQFTLLERQDHYPASHAQKRLWLLSQFEGGNSAYNIVVGFYIAGTLEQENLDKAFQSLVEKHEILRTVFTEINGELRQVVKDKASTSLEVTDLSLKTAKKKYLKEEITRLSNAGFDLANGPLVRIRLVRLSGTEQALLLCVHHIVCDGWSVSVLVKELLHFYKVYRQNEGGVDTGLKIQYKEYTHWLEQRIAGVRGEQAAGFWKSQFAADTDPLNLPYDLIRPGIKSFEGAIAKYYLVPGIYDSIVDFCKRHQLTVFNFLRSTFTILLSRFSGQDDITIGTPVSVRNHYELEEQIGLYINTLPLRMKIDPEDNFTAFANKVSTNSAKAFEFQEYPLDKIIEDITVKRMAGRNPLFDVVMAIQNTTTSGDSNTIKGQLGFDLFPLDSYLYRSPAIERTGISSKFDLSFNFGMDPGNKFFLEIEYATSLLAPSRIRQFYNAYLFIIEQVLDRPGMKVREIETVNAAEKKQLLQAFNDTGTLYQRDKTIIDLLEQQVKKTPDQPALQCGEVVMTWEQLNQTANQFGHYIRNKYKLRPDDLVGIKLERSEWLVLSLLGVLKAGGAYVPIDPGYPQDRIDYMIADSGCRMVIDEEELEKFRQEQSNYKKTDLRKVNRPGDLAYVMYTSGSTGRPKGVMIANSSVVSFFENFPERFYLEAGMSFGATTNFTFDISVLELLGTLVRGIKLVLITEAEPTAILKYATDHRVDALQVTPSRLSQLLEADTQEMAALSQLKVLLVGGEAMSQQQYETLKRLEAVKVINVYGPTETTIWSTSLELKKSSGLSIGKPLLNERILIVDNYDKLCPPGVAGEICIGGEGLARGYWNKPELTAGKFVPHPFIKGERIYRTGDLGRWLMDGNIEFIGRKDDQVKVRGYRIELGEIENTLQRHADIDACVVVVRTGADNEKVLVAYLVSKKILNISDIRRYLGKALPVYMLPNYFVQIEELPLTANGKADRNNLPDPVEAGLLTGASYLAPRNNTEEKLVAIWSEVLGIKRESIGVKDNFFDLGGYSLKATRLASQIHKTFEIKLALQDLFTAVVPEDQALLIDQAIKEVFVAIKPVEQQPAYPLSAAQRRLWVLSQFEEANTGYNMPGAYVFEGELNRSALKYAFSYLIERHESLRTVFKEDEHGEIKQLINTSSATGFTIGYVDFRQEQDYREQLNTLIKNDYIAPFQLSAGPLLRANLYQLNDRKWVFTYVMHHIISDGWSMEVLVKELLLLYNAFIAGDVPSLSPLRIQYKDYSAWQQVQLTSEALQSHKEYWLKQFQGTLPVPGLNTDKARPVVKTYNGASATRLFDATTSKGIKNYGQAQGCTLFMSLLAAVDILLYRYSQQEDIIIGTPMSGREHADLHDQIGFYANTLALRTRFKGQDSYRELLENVKQLTLEAYEYQSYPFNELVEQLHIQRDASRNPLFDVQVIVNDKTVPDQSGELKISEYKEAAIQRSVFDMVFTFVETEQGLQSSITYNTDIYSRELVDQLGTHLESLLSTIIINPGLAVNQLEFLTATEKQQLLTSFNDTAMVYPANKTLVNLFEDQALKTPGAIAVVSGEEEFTYKELDERSNQLANYLRANYRVQADDLIGLMADRSASMLVAMLGILKAGAGYVPIDPSYPRTRKEFIVKDTGIGILLTQTGYLFDLDYYEGNIFAIDVQLDTIDTSAAPCDAVIRSKDLAYVIYTSGSTGEPKGVMIEHGAIVNTVYGQQELFNARQGDKNLQFASLSFDASVSEIFVSLASGGALYIIGEEEKKSPELLEQYIATHQIGIATIPPAYLKLLQIENLQSLKTLVTAGEAGRAEDANRFLPYGDYLNAYGPTESSICATTYKVKKGGQVPVASVPIGIPIPNAVIYIIDSHSNLVPPGVNGEICIGGAGLARGYLNRPELSAEKFVSNPFREGERMYRTGDLGRWLPDGNIEFTGRKDDQVKIRGYRIELGEIESALHSYPTIGSAVAVIHINKEEEKELVAYVTSKETLLVTDLRNYLGNILPGYMIPAHFVQMEVLPVNTNGKIDRKALPDPAEAGIVQGITYVAPVNEMEQQLVEVYQEVLRKQGIGTQADFFVLGGDSIKSIQVVARLKQRGYSLTIQDVLLYPVIKELSVRLKAFNRVAAQGIVEGLVPLSPIQQFFFRQYPINNHHYNQSVLLYRKERISEQALRGALDQLVLHHDVLRTVFYEGPEGWVQENKGTAQSYYSLEVIEAEDETACREHCERIQSGIDLSAGPLFKAALFHGTDGDRLLLVAHHLIIDGVSWRILFEDLSALYQQGLAGEPLSLPLKTDSFRYYQEKQLEYAAGKGIQKEESYWSGIEATAIPGLPSDYVEGSNLAKDVALCSFVLDKRLTNQLLTQSYKAYRTGINDILLTGLSLAVAQTFGQDKIIINLEGHGRESIGADTDITRTIGWFTTSYPVVFDMRYRDYMRRQLVEVKESLHRVPNKGIGYGILRYFNHKEYTLNPEINFNYLGDFGSGINTRGGELLFEFVNEYRGKETADNMSRNAMLDVSGMLVNDELQLSVAYSKEQYNATTIRKLSETCQQLLMQLIEQLSEEENTYLTPVDLTYKQLEADQVSQLNKEYDLEDIYPLSPLQEGLYYHWLSAPDSPAYFVQTCCRLKGKLDIAVLEKSYQALIERHGILRVSFIGDMTDISLQVIRKKAATDFTYVNAPGNEEPFTSDQKRSDRSRGFDLHNSALMRLTVVGQGDDTYEFIWSHHHIIMDGWCGSILIREFFQIYDAFIAGKKPELDKVFSYAGYINWLSKVDKQKSLTYWKDYLAGYDSITTLPKFLSAVKPGYLALKRSFWLEEKLASEMNMLCTGLGVTENTFIQLVWGILLAKYNNTTDVVFGSVVSGRPPELEGVEGMIGLFSNTVPVRITLQEGITVKELLKEIQQSSIRASDHHYVQLAEVQAESELGRNLFDHVMVFENFPIQEVMRGMNDGGAFSFLSSDVLEQTNYDLTLTIIPGKRSEIRIDCNANLYTEEQVSRLRDHFLQIAAQIVENPERIIHEIDCLSLAERQELLVEFNDTAVSYPVDRTLVELFEEQVIKTPNNIAIEFDRKKVTYQELNELSNQLGDYLRKNYSIGANDMAGIKLDRSDRMILAILAVLKAGGAYLPIDTSYPEERIRYMTEDSGCKVVIDENEIIKFGKEQKKYTKKNLTGINKAADLTYVIYTSGSTGQPKGTRIRQESFVNLIHWYKKTLELRQDDSVLLMAPVSFDLAQKNIFTPLLFGARLCLPSRFQEDYRILAETIADHEVTVVCAAPSAFYPLLDKVINDDYQKLSTLRKVVLGGETILVNELRNWVRSGLCSAAVINSYGPTECTDIICSYRVANDAWETLTDIPIGSPVDNTHLYILDDHYRLLPIGVAGEIFASGICVGNGYLNKPELTAEKFVSNPFAEGEWMYRTGDIGRWLPNGTMEFLGRKDDQVKIHGYRIELGEIETALQAYADIDLVVVLAKPNKEGVKELVAYLVGKKKLNTADIRSYLGQLLPSHMVPHHLIQLDKLPLTPSGKVDKKSLPAPQDMGEETGTIYVAPRNQTEKRLLAIWKEVLDREVISVKDNFFSLGGHSLKATRLSSRVYKEFEIRVPLQHLFTNATLEEQARLIRTAQKSAFVPVSPVPLQPDYALSSSQRRLWILSQLEEGNIGYNLPGVYILKGQPDHKALTYAFDTLIGRHESLRTVFRENDKEEIRQVIRTVAETGFTIACHDVRGLPHEQVNEIIEQEFVKPFDLSEGPLLRAGLYQADTDKWLFVYVMHHIISDGWSMEILIKELLSLYGAHTQGQANPLTPLLVQYKDYTAWQQERLKDDSSQEHKAYWLKQLEGELPVLDLATNKIRPVIKTYNGSVICSAIHKETTRKLKLINEEHGSTLFMSLLTAVNILLHRYSGQEDIIIGSPVAGREHADLESQIGFYVNTLPLRSKINGKASYKQLLEDIRRITLEAYEHQSYPFDELINELHLQRDRSRSPLFDVSVVLQNAALDMIAASGNLADLYIHPYDEIKNTTSVFDLAFDFTETDEGISTSIIFNTDVFDKEMIERLSMHFEQLLITMVENPFVPVGQLEFLKEEERDQLLLTFNDTGSSRFEEKTVTQLFEQQASAFPDAVAVMVGTRLLTYQQLNEQANQLANYLKRRYRIRPDDLVAIQLERSEWPIISILAVLKSGGAYVPIDPSYPKERMEYMVSDSGCKVVINEQELEDFRKTGNKYSRKNLLSVSGLSNLAYVIYTSGSTGLPKGCCITHGNLSNYIQWANRFYFKGSALGNFGLYTSLSFDLTVTSIFCSLSLGSRLKVYDQQEELAAVLYDSFNEKSGIDSIKLTPSHIHVLKHLAITSSTMKCAIVGGEEVTPEQVSILKSINPLIRIYNEYGPTEATVGCIVKELEVNQPVLIGRPVYYARIYILNEEDRLCPPGITGEIYIGGAGLAQGYLNRPLLTAEKFVPDPFMEGEKMYKTGDLGRWQTDGNLKFLGRKDDQVKIRGHRVEPGEIEAALQGHPSINSAVVITRVNQEANKDLVAYITGGEILDPTGIRTYLNQTLPAYMIPNYFVQLETMPLTINGKVDKKALPGPEGAGIKISVMYVPPANETEEKLVQIWQKILGGERIGAEDDFFDLGGDSLKATRLVSLIKKEFNVEIDLKNVLWTPTIKVLADKINTDKWLQVSLAEDSFNYEEIKI